MAGPWEDYQPKSKTKESGPWDDYKNASSPNAVSSPNSAQAALEGFGQGVGMGYLPHLQALAGGLVPNPSGAEDEELRKQGFIISQPEDTYLSRRDENLKRQEQFKEESPGAYYGGLIGGSIASAPAIGGAISKLPLLQAGANAPKLGLLGKTAQAAGAGAVQGLIQNPGDEIGVADPFQVDERLRNAKTGAIVGGAANLAAAGIKATADTVKSIPSKLQSVAETKAFKSSGAMLKDFRRAFGKDRVNAIGKEMIDSGLVKPGNTFEDVATGASKIKEETGKRIGEIYDRVKTNVNVAIDQDKMMSDLVDAVSNPKIRPKINTESYDAAMEKIIGNIVKDPKKVADVRYLNDMIGEIDDMINYSKRANELPYVQQGYMQVRHLLRKSINDITEATGNMIGNKSLGDELKELNRRYGVMAEVSAMAKDRVARENANRMFSLTDTIAGVGGAAGGAVTGGLLQGDIEGGLKGAALGAGLGLLNKGARQYGNPILTTGLYKTGRMLQSVPSPVTTAASKLGGLLTENPAITGAAASNLLQQPVVNGAKPKPRGK